jgi:hypothetical protein
MLRLLDEAAGVPLIFAAVMPTGTVILEEFTDALSSLNWTNSFARPISFEESDDEKDGEVGDSGSSSDDEDDDGKDAGCESDTGVVIGEDIVDNEKSSSKNTEIAVGEHSVNDT